VKHTQRDWRLHRRQSRGRDRGRTRVRGDKRQGCDEVQMRVGQRTIVNSRRITYIDTTTFNTTHPSNHVGSKHRYLGYSTTEWHVIQHIFSFSLSRLQKKQTLSCINHHYRKPDQTHKDKVTVFVGSPFEEREYLKEDKNEGLFDLDCVLPMG